MRCVGHCSCRPSKTSSLSSSYTCSGRSLRSLSEYALATRRRVVSPRMKRVALTQALQRKQAAPRATVRLEDRDGVSGARRLEAALPAQERTQDDLVRADERDE